MLFLRIIIQIKERFWKWTETVNNDHVMKKKDTFLRNRE